MSAPELPEIFGNYTLGEFVEVASPQSVSWLPQTAGWYWLGAGLLIILLRFSYKRLQRWHHNRYRREAAQRLAQITAQDNTENVLVAVNRLMKLAAIAGFGREQVASLTGEDWVTFLNSRCDEPPFNPALANCLAAGPYRDSEVDAATLEQLMSACNNWLHNHREQEHA